MVVDDDEVHHARDIRHGAHQQEGDLHEDFDDQKDGPEAEGTE